MAKNIKKESFIYHILTAIFLDIGLFYLTALHLAYGWFFVVNFVLFTSFGLDKYAAKKNKRRTPETTFLWLAFLGGFPALLIGRKVFRHKTVKKEFIIPMWILFVLQITLVIWAINDFILP